MSSLRKLVNSLIKVIVGYHDIRTGKMQISDKLQPIDEFLAMEPDVLNTTLANLINHTAKTTKETRVNFLEYLAYIIKTIKPFIDHENPLSASEIELITEILTNLIIHTQKLHPLSHHAQYTFTYHDKTISAFGFLGGIVLSSLCLTGELMQRYCPAYYLALNPTEYPASEIRQEITQYITEHQTLRQFQCLARQNQSLEQEKIVLTQQLKSLQTPKKEGVMPPLKPVAPPQPPLAGYEQFFHRHFRRRPLPSTRPASWLQTENDHEGDRERMLKLQPGKSFDEIE